MGRANAPHLGRAGSHCGGGRNDAGSAGHGKRTFQEAERSGRRKKGIQETGKKKKNGLESAGGWVGGPTGRIGAGTRRRLTLLQKEGGSTGENQAPSIRGEGVRENAQNGSSSHYFKGEGRKSSMEQAGQRYSVKKKKKKTSKIRPRERGVWGKKR